MKPEESSASRASKQERKETEKNVYIVYGCEYTRQYDRRR